MKKLTNFFNCAAKAASKTGGGTSQTRGHQLGVASVITSTLSRFDYVSLASGLRVLDNIRGISALLSSRVYRYAAVLLMVFMVGIGNVWGAQTYKTSYTDLTETSTGSGVYYTMLTQTNVGSYKTAGWLDYYNPSDATKTVSSLSGGSATLGINPATDASYTGSSASYYKVGSSKGMVFYLKNISSIKIYAVIASNGRHVQAQVNSGSAYKLIDGTTAGSYVETIDLSSTASSNNIVKVYGTGDLYICAIKVTPASSSGPSISSFSPATGATVKSGTTVTVTGSTGSTVYYMWGSSAPANAAAVVSGGTAGTAGTATVTSSGINSANGTNLYAVAVKDATNSAVATASYTIDDTAPTLSSSNPANSATDVAVSGTIVLTFSEEIASVDGSKFSLSGATKGTVAIDGTDATKVNVPYSGAANSATVTLSVAAGAVSDASSNASAALSNISFTTVAGGGGDSPTLDVEFTTQTISDWLKSYTEGVTFAGDGGFSSNSGYYYSGCSGQTSSSNGLNKYYFGISAASGKKITKVSLLISPNGTSAAKPILMGWDETATFTNVAFYEMKTGTSTSNAKTSAEWLTWDLSGDDEINDVRIYRRIASSLFSKDGGTTYISDGGTSVTLRIWRVKVWLADASAPTTYTLTASATVINPMTADSKTGAISTSITNSPVSGITSGTTTSTSSNTFTVAKATPVTVTAPATVPGSAAECDECTYRFDSWENIPASVTADVNNIHAKYNTTYSISYTLDGGDWADAYSAPTYYVYGTGLTLPVAANVEKEGYTFTGWTLDYDDSDISTIGTTTWGTIAVTAQWTAASAPTHSITYNAESLKGSDVSSYPTEYTEGVGIASFAALADVTNFHFNGWSPASISAEATTDVELTATWVAAYNVTFAPGTGASGTAPATFQKWQGATFSLPGQGDMVAPSGYAFDGWNDGTNDYAEGDTYTMGNAAVTITAQWAEIPTHTISLDANGGSVASYEGWVKEGDVYSKTVEEGTEVSLLAFTKADVQLLFFRDGSANEYTSTVTLNADLSLKAVWGEEKEVELYYWEGKSDGATERGGEAVTMESSGTPKSANEDVNYHNSTYYTLRVQGKSDYSKQYIRITTDEAVKTGDKITFTGYINKESEKDAALLMKAGDKVLFAETTSLPNISYPAETPGSPVEREYTISTSDVNATVLDMMRNTGHDATNCFVTQLVITGNRVVEVLDPAVTPSITVQPVGANYTWKESVSALTVTASVTDGGTLHYQWYKAGETDTKVGSDANSYTPTESGTYYVVVTNKKTGYSDKSTTSSNATVTIGTRPSYTVTYYDGASSLGTESVQEDASPTNYAAKQAKAVYGISGLYEFVGWYNNSDLASEHAIANIAALAITGNTDIYGKWTRIEALDVNMVEEAAKIAGDASTEEEMNAFKTLFTGKGYVYANLNALDNKSGNNGAYLGLKTKSDEAYIAFNVPANKRVTVKLGYMEAAAEMYINGVQNTTQALTGGSKTSGDNYANWNYDVTEASTFKLQMTTGSTCVVKAITIGEIPAKSDDATLSDLTVGGTTVAGFAANKEDYYVELPYGTTTAPTVAGTAHDDKASAVVVQASTPLPDNATITVTAENGTTVKTYTVHFTVAPKFGVELIKATHTGTKAASKAGYWAEDVTVDKDTQSKKLGANDDYFGLTLSGSKKFMNGDLLCIYLDPNEDASQWLQVFKDKGNNIIIDRQSGITKGANYFTLSELPEDGIDKLYLYRTSTAGAKMNPYVDYIAVYREMDPFFESFTVAGEDATIDETVSPKTINVIVPAVTDITALTPTYKAWANSGATVSPTTAQNFSTGAIDYTVTSEYSETTTYKVTVTKAAAIKEVVISGTLTVMEDNTTTLSAAVYDTNDALAANQNVTWSVKSGDESLAEVDANGVVTGKAVGTAHIIATSVADDSKSAEVAVTVNAFVGTKRVYWFAYAADATENGVTNNSTVFGSAPTGSNSGARTVTLEEGWVMNTTKYAGAPGSTGTFVVPAEYTATFYAAAKASGNGGRYIQLKQGDVVKYTSNEFEGNDPQVVKIEGVVAGTYTIAYFGGMSNFYLYAAELSRYAITSVTLESGFMLRTENSRTPAMTIVHAKAAIASQTWSILSSTATGTTINASTGEITAGTTPGTITVQVVVEDVMGNEVTSNICTVEIVEEFERIDVTGSTTWDWNELSMSDVYVSTDRGLALANYIEGEKWQMLNGANGDYAYRSESSGCYEALNGSSSLSFHTTVPGLVKISGKRRSNDAVVKINGEITVGTVTSSVQTFAAVGVQAGEVTIAPDANGMRITKIEFIAASELDPADADYIRDLNNGNIGTICLPKAGFMVGATVFSIAEMDYKDNMPYKIYFDEVENGAMQAGKPYVFLPDENSSKLGVFYTSETPVDPSHENGLYGYYTDNSEERYRIPKDEYNFIISGNKYWYVNDDRTYALQNRAYIKLDEVPGFGGFTPSAGAAPGRRRISLGAGSQAPSHATGFENIEALDGRVQKVLIDGKIYILRGEKMYDATGRLVK